MLDRARGDHAACEEVEPPANDCTRDRDVLVSCIDANGACVWRVHSNRVHRSEYTKTVLAHARHPSGESRSQPSCMLTTAAPGKQCNSALPPQFRMPHAKRPLKPAEGAAASRRVMLRRNVPRRLPPPCKVFCRLRGRTPPPARLPTVPQFAESQSVLLLQLVETRG